jgi:hypothetical protein
MPQFVGKGVRLRIGDQDWGTGFVSAGFNSYIDPSYDYWSPESQIDGPPFKEVEKLCYCGNYVRIAFVPCAERRLIDAKCYACGKVITIETRPCLHEEWEIDVGAEIIRCTGCGGVYPMEGAPSMIEVKWSHDELVAMLKPAVLEMALRQAQEILERQSLPRMDNRECAHTSFGRVAQALEYHAGEKTAELCRREGPGKEALQATVRSAINGLHSVIQRFAADLCKRLCKGLKPSGRATRRRP